jgi:hypothetical protein
VRELLFPSREGCEYGLSKGHSMIAGEAFDAALLVFGKLYLDEVSGDSGHYRSALSKI